MQSGFAFYYPKEAIKEVLKYKELIKEKASLNEEEFYLLYHSIIPYIKLVPQKEINFLEKAKNIIIKIDADDIIFIALALTLNFPIWTEDTHFKKQNIIKVYTTNEIIKLISK